MNLNQQNIRNSFPYFNAKKNADVIYFDNAATTHKPNIVIDTISQFYKESNSNIHRSNHNLSFSATEKYENCRNTIRDFIGAKSSSEIIFTSGATESINLVSQTYGDACIKENDVILVSNIEHHSNTIPWHMVAKKNKAIIQEIPVNRDLVIDEKKFQNLLNNKVKLIALHHISNVSGIKQNIKQLTLLAKKFNIPVLIDGAQAPSHIDINVSELGCDFYCFSGHKIFGPTGTGVLFIASKHLEKLPPYKTGGQMVEIVNPKEFSWSKPPLKFEAGTPNIAGIIGLCEAIKFINKISLNKIHSIENSLMEYVFLKLNSIPGITLYGNNEKTAPIFAFNIDGIHHYDISTILSEENILIRSGHLCNQGLMNFLNIDGCLRASLSFYNSIEEVDIFIDRLKWAVKFLKR